MVSIIVRLQLEKVRMEMTSIIAVSLYLHFVILVGLNG